MERCFQRHAQANSNRSLNETRFLFISITGMDAGFLGDAAGIFVG
jgi:hypothetical protein